MTWQSSAPNVNRVQIAVFVSVRRAMRMRTVVRPRLCVH